MKKRQKIVISITFVNGDADTVLDFYDGKITHREIYLAGVEALREEE